MQTVVSTTTSHRAKRDEAQLRVGTHEYADAMRVPEHYASTLRTRTMQAIRYLRPSMPGSREACE